MFVRVFKALGPVDVRNVRRDPLLKAMIVLPLLMPVLLRFVIPALGQLVLAELGFDLSPYYKLIISCVLITMLPGIAGLVIGFLLLDERDDHTLTALQVTPVSLSTYLAYRLAVPGVVSVLMTVVSFWIIGLPLGDAPLLLPPLGLLPLLLVALVAALLAPMLALALVAFAGNKVEGFALMKGMGSGILIIPPLIAYFVPLPWQLLLSVFPTYWPLKLYWVFLDGERGAWIYALVGALYLLAVVGLLVRRFERVMSR